METKNSWIPTIRVTTLATWLLIAGLGAWGGVEYTKLAYGIKDAPQMEAAIDSDEYKKVANNINEGVY